MPTYVRSICDVSLRQAVKDTDQTQLIHQTRGSRSSEATEFVKKSSLSLSLAAGMPGWPPANENNPE